MYEKNVEIQQKIKEARVRQGISVRKFAKMMECTPRAVSLWDAGQRAITIEMADKALKALGLSAIIGGEGEGGEKVERDNKKKRQ